MAMVRDADNWPVLACAMTIACPVWTEDADFFGAGIATWTTDRVALVFGRLILNLTHPWRRYRAGLSLKHALYLRLTMCNHSITFQP